ncbi:MAG: DnaB-like helicase C-terminal domain-containing protein [Candidatus Sulfobium sp.]|jgi:replicative DNA helicase
MANERIRKLQPYTLDMLGDDIAQSAEGLRTGFIEVDRALKIPQGAITIIAARPSHGKTTFLLNLFLNMLRIYSDKAFFYFSYQESKIKIALKLINILSGDLIDREGNVGELERYLREGSSNRPKVEKGKDEFRKLTESGRLWIIDEPYRLEDLVDVMAFLAGKYDVGAVVIDFLQKISPGKGHPDNMDGMQLVSQRLLENAKGLMIPVIIGAQLKWSEKKVLRLDNFIDMIGVVQDASLVIGLYNDAVEKAQSLGEVIKERQIDIKLSVLKNRTGQVNKTFTLGFDIPLLTIREKF